MKYLLSTGECTNNVVKYIQDMILINMKLLPNEIPYSSTGSSELIQDVLEVNLKGHVSQVINEVISRIQQKFPNIKIGLENLVVDGRRVSATISVDNVVETYDIA